MSTTMHDLRTAQEDEADAADTAHLQRALERLAPALTRFNAFDGPDPTVPKADRWMSAIDTPLPRRGDGLDAVVDTLIEDVVPYGLRMGAPGFCGWVTGQPTASGTIASLAQAVAGPQRFFFHPFTLLEDVGLRWLAELLGIPGDLHGVFTSGGSSATLVALAAARQRAGEQIGHDIAADGMPAGRSWKIYASSEVHHVVARSAAALGLGRVCVCEVDCDEQQRIDPRALERALERGAREGAMPLAIVATAGTVNTGAVDPIAAVADIAERHDAWLHVDGAYGLFGVLDERVRPLFDGLERADSVIVDPHKWMATPVGCGAAFVRDAELLHRTFTLEPAAYLEGAVGARDELRSPWDNFAGDHHNLSIEQSAPPRGVQVWAVLREIGSEGMRKRVSRHMDLARRLAAHAHSEPRLEVIAEPVLSICCLRYVADLDDERLDALNEAILQQLQSRTRLVPSATRVAGRFAIRPCFINPRTGAREVDDLAAAIVELGDELVRGSA